jgi:hypothetical protein
VDDDDGERAENDGKKNNLHLAIIRIIPYTKSISRVAG